MVWNPNVGPLTDPWAALAGNDVAATDMTNNITANFNALFSAFLSGWTSYTPVWTQGISVPHTLIYAKYLQIGNTIMGNASFTATGAGTASNVMSVSLPVTPVSNALMAGGAFSYIGASGTRAAGLTILGTVTGNINNAWFQPAATTNVLGLAGVTTIASTDQFTFSFVYEIP